MALYDPLFGRMSGKLGGLVFGNGPGGSFVRSWQVPTDPGTPAQETVRAATTQLSNRWVGTLTAAQRTGWETYAANVTVPGRFGNQIHISGISMYARSNVARIQYFGAPGIKDDAPVIYNLGEYSAPNFTFTAYDTVNVNFNTGDDWVSEDGAAMLVYASRDQNPTRNYFKGPYRKCVTAILGNLATPPPSPTLLTLPFLGVELNRTFFFTRVMRNDGRVSAPTRAFGVPNLV